MATQHCQHCTECRRPSLLPLDTMGLCPSCARTFLRWIARTKVEPQTPYPHISRMIRGSRSLTPDWDE